MSLILFLIIIVMGIMWHCEPNMMRDMVAKSKIILEKAKVAVVPGSAFGIEDHVRISIAIDMESLKKAMHRLNKLCS